MTRPPGKIVVDELLPGESSTDSGAETDPWTCQTLLGGMCDLFSGALIYASHGPGNTGWVGSER